MNRTLTRWGAAAISLAALSIGFAGCKGMGVKVGDGSTTKFVSKPGPPNEPDVTFPELQGGDLPLATLKGKVVLVNFWATWCEPCQIEIPWLIEMQQKYAAKGFTVLGIAMDEEGASVVTPWVNKERFDVNGSQSQM